MYNQYSELYSKWCELYDPNNIELTIIEKYCSFKNQDVLDIGCGTGRFMFRILPLAKSILGVDNDEKSIAILNKILQEKYSKFITRAEVRCCNIEDLISAENSIDIAVFSWSFYALNKEQMVHSLKTIHSMLRKDGKLIILQPVGGAFEEIMRTFFNEHTDMDEYNDCLALMNEVTSSFTKIATDYINSEFVVNDIIMLADALKMFALTEGNSTDKELQHITPNRLENMIEKNKKDGAYHLNDEVAVFVFEKKR